MVQRCDVRSASRSARPCYCIDASTNLSVHQTSIINPKSVDVDVAAAINVLTRPTSTKRTKISESDVVQFRLIDAFDRIDHRFCSKYEAFELLTV